jgi:hypothetical protein
MAKTYTLWVAIEEHDNETGDFRDIELTEPVWIEEARGLDLPDLLQAIKKVDPRWGPDSMETALEVLKREVER